MSRTIWVMGVNRSANWSKNLRIKVQCAIYVRVLSKVYVLYFQACKGMINLNCITYKGEKGGLYMRFRYIQQTLDGHLIRRRGLLLKFNPCDSEVMENLNGICIPIREWNRFKTTCNTVLVHTDLKN